MERKCKKHGLTEFGARSDGGYRCKKCQVNSVQKRREVIKQKAIDYKGGKCVKCDYNKCNAALDFHHIDPSQKDFNIAAKGYTRSWNKVKAELDKCILLCANCHREIHSKGG